MRELVSVVITTYGRTDKLVSAVKSVQNQTYQNIEIIIVDDNAKDLAIRNKVKELISKLNDRRIIYIQNLENMGGAESRNVGIKASNGNYIAFLDDDDEYLPQKIELQLQLFFEDITNKLALVYCYTNSYNEKNDLLHEYKKNIIGNNIYEAMLDCIAATSQWMCSKEALMNVGLFSNVPSKQDSTVILKFMLKGYTVNRLPMVLTKYIEHGGERISSGGKKNIEGELLLREKCRKAYNHLTEIQKREVEYSFSTRLARLYIINNMEHEFKSEFKKMIGIHLIDRRTLSIVKTWIRVKIIR